jgi:hypothetical protein
MNKKISVLTLIVLVFNILTSVVCVQGANYFCGYEYEYSYSGVSGTIRTRDHDTPSGEFGCEWIMIVLSYANGYYIQCGYTEQDECPDTRNWFIELRDVDNTDPVDFSIYTPSAPVVGTTYFYQIDSPSGGWNLICKEGATTKWSTTKSSNPSTYSGLQAMCETTDTDVTIDGSRFRYLSYYTTAGGGDWRLWDDYNAAKDSPYTLTELDDYEFNADGGG